MISIRDFDPKAEGEPMDLSGITFNYEGSIVNYDGLLCKIGPVGFYDLAKKLMGMADEDISNAICESKPAINKIFYYGTNLDSAGHFFWEIEGNYFHKSSIWFKDIPFDPENLVNGLNFGIVKYFRFDKEYAICAISGSCSDERGGTKSIFWVKNDFTKLGELKDIILNIPVAKKIIEKMPFEVKW